MEITCSKCGDIKELNRMFTQTYCRKCHAENSRANRRKHGELNPDAKKRANARSYANRYIKYGILKKQHCSNCGEVKAEMHHEDYDKPLEVIWLCRPCHLELHSVSCETIQ